MYVCVCVCVCVYLAGLAGSVAGGIVQERTGGVLAAEPAVVTARTAGCPGREKEGERER